jgi:hypothetical protein
MTTELYGRRLLLRNCGRFLHVAGDFGSNYSTHPYLSSEMLYAGLTRELARRPRSFTGKMSGYDFFGDFDVASRPVWFTPGILLNKHTMEAAGRNRNLLDAHLFNSTLEERPGIQDNNRLPKYGSMETVLPGNTFGAWRCRRTGTCWRIVRKARSSGWARNGPCSRSRVLARSLPRKPETEDATPSMYRSLPNPLGLSMRTRSWERRNATWSLGGKVTSSTCASLRRISDVYPRSPYEAFWTR